MLTILSAIISVWLICGMLHIFLFSLIYWSIVLLNFKIFLNCRQSIPKFITGTWWSVWMGMPPEAITKRTKTSGTNGRRKTETTITTTCRPLYRSWSSSGIWKNKARWYFHQSCAGGYLDIFFFFQNLGVNISCEWGYNLEQYTIIRTKYTERYIVQCKAEMWIMTSNNDM